MTTSSIIRRVCSSYTFTRDLGRVNERIAYSKLTRKGIKNNIEGYVNAMLWVYILLFVCIVVDLTAKLSTHSVADAFIAW